MLQRTKDEVAIHPCQEQGGNAGTVFGLWSDVRTNLLRVMMNGQPFIGCHSYYNAAALADYRRANILLEIKPE